MVYRYPPERILVCTDFSEQSRHALAYAAETARACKSKLLVLHVGPPIPDITFPLPEATAIQAAAWTETLREREEQICKRLEQEVAAVAESPDAELIYVEGEPSTAIVHTAESRACDLLVLGSHGRTGLARVLMGSVTERSARHVHCPVLVVK
jgi:nucleotide-binding universal stress UspA family protein